MELEDGSADPEVSMTVAEKPSAHPNQNQFCQWCCSLMNTHFDMGDVHVYVINLLTGLLLVTTQLVVLWKLNRDFTSGYALMQLNQSMLRPSNRKSVLSYYYTFFQLSFIIFLAEVVQLLALPEGDVAKVVAALLFSVQCGYMDNFVWLSLVEERISLKSKKRTNLMSLIVGLTYVLVVLFVDNEHEFTKHCSFCSAFLPTLSVVYVYIPLSAIYVIFVWWSWPKRRLLAYELPYRGRPGACRWFMYCGTVYTMGSVGISLVLYAASDFGFCLYGFAICLYSVVWGPLLYTTVTQDSDHCIRLGLCHQSTDGDRHLAETGSAPLFQSNVIPRIAADALRIEYVIGRGGFGEVSRATWNGVHVAVKRFTVPANAEDVDLKEFEKELEIHSQMRHPNIVLLLGFCDRPAPALVTEWMNQGSLFRVLHGKVDGKPCSQGLTMKIKLETARHVASGMAYLHQHEPPIIHRDLKSHNVLIDEHWNVKVCDFGFSRVVSLNTTMTRVGTVQWTAPEILRQEPYDSSADVYSFGIVLWEIITETIPYHSYESALAIMHSVAYNNERLKIPHTCPASVASLIEDCWSSNRHTRPPFPVICERLTAILNNPEDLKFVPDRKEATVARDSVTKSA